MASASSSDIEQLAAAALRRVTPVAAAPARAEELATGRAQAAAMQRQRTAQRAMVATETGAKLASARSLADQTFSRRRELKGLKDELRGLEAQLREALTVQMCSKSKCGAMESEAMATESERLLRASVAEVRDKRDRLAAIISERLQALESLEAECNEDAEMEERVRKAVLWYDNFLGLRIIVVQGGVNFVFDKIDPQRPEKEYSFRLSRSLTFIQCDPHVKDIEELAKDLNLNEHLYKFVRMAREKFKSSFMIGTLPVSPVVLLPAKRQATPLSGVRRSPRLEGVRGASS